MGESEVRFRFPDPDRRLAGVRLQQRAGLRDTDLRYDEADRSWVLFVAAPAAWRIEYQFELLHRDGGVETVDDPGNPTRVAGAFGDKSVWQSPAYSPPAWL